jgi:hypothetical protein
VLTLKRFGVTTVLVASMAIPATAAAQGQDLRNPDRQAPAAQQTQDIRNADRRAPEAPAQLQDLRNADRRAPGAGDITPVHVPAVTAIESPAEGFDWGDAGIGAVGAVALLSMLVGLTFAATQRRRGSGVPA